MREQLMSAADSAKPRSWERFVALLPAACAIHCLLTPFLAVAVPFVAFGPTGEWIAFAISTVLAFWAVRTTARTHGQRAVWVLLVLGALVWGASVAEVLVIGGEKEWTAGLGGLILATGVIWSSRLRHRRVCATGGCMV